MSSQRSQTIMFYDIVITLKNVIKQESQEKFSICTHRSDKKQIHDEKSYQKVHIMYSKVLLTPWPPKVILHDHQGITSSLFKTKICEVIQ